MGRKTAAAASPKARAKRIRARLERELPAPRCELDHDGAWPLVVATILSAQSTDATVNRVTPQLFAKYPTPAALAAADISDVEALVKSTGFFRNKAKAIVGAAKHVTEHCGGEVPRTMHEITQLPGVARKTGNVVLGTAYGIPSGFVVDTHAGRVARRLGITKEQKPERVEADLMSLFPKRTWIDMGHRFVLHGRYVCTSKKPRCVECPLNELCDGREAAPEGRWTARADALASELYRVAGA
jgi:endonuclease-3